MNERIKELIEKATVRGVEYRPGDNGHPTPTVYFDKEKFGELIVRECANQCDPEPGLKYSPNAKSSREDCKSKIFKHFGVEQ